MRVYGNPQPYPDPGAERAALEGRLKVAQRITEMSSDPAKAARWRRITDELLDHLAEVDARAASAALDAAVEGSKTDG